MISNHIIEQIQGIVDIETGGDNALDGFEFQVSSAIYLMFEKLKNDIEFGLLYEKVEDFIIFSENIELYQAKSLKNNLTVNILCKRDKSKNKEDESEDKLSIIQKIQRNYERVLKVIPDKNIECTLIMCENSEFSNKLIKEYKDKRELNFENLDKSIKEEIVLNTGEESFSWSNINARRLIPKSRHEEVTRIYLEDVIVDKYKTNLINSSALYNAITYEIRKSRKSKELLKSTTISENIVKCVKNINEYKFKDYNFMLTDIDRRNLKIAQSFSIFSNYILIENHPINEHIKSIKEIFDKNELTDTYEIYNYISNSSDKLIEELKLLRADYEIKALILLTMAKEGIV